MFNSRIYLRALEPEDAKISMHWRNDREIQSMVGGPSYFVSLERENKWVMDSIFDENRIVLGICLKKNNKYIGNVMLQQVDWINRTGRVPILLGDKNEWGKGYATEARMMMLHFAFFERGLHRISAEILEDNIASIQLHKRCGFVEEGVLRSAIYKNGEYKNVVVMGVLQEDFVVAYDAYVKRCAKI